jgi:hypothetical protein
MLPKTETACFAIADISGYTHFVSGVELDHAQDIIADVMHAGQGAASAVPPGEVRRGRTGVRAMADIQLGTQSTLSRPYGHS